MAGVYSILLADDEEEVRTSIIHKIDWEKIGFVVVGDAENGEDALEKIEILEPDVVLTDIRMPYMDGLTLAKRIQISKPSIKVVIFSGFDDFEYAKEAIKLNIIEYILKPVNAEELTQILITIKNSLDEEVENLKNINGIREVFVKSLPILRENFLNNLMREGLEGKQIETLLKEYQLNLGEASLWSVIQINIEQAEENPIYQEAGFIQLAIKRLLDTSLKENFIFESFFSTSGLCAVLGAKDSLEVAKEMTALSEVCRESKRKLNQVITIGMGEARNSLATLKKSYKQAGEAVGYKAIYGIGDVIYIGDVESSKNKNLYLSSKTEADLVTSIKFGAPEKIKACVNHISDKMRKDTFHESQYQAYIISVFNVILQLIEKYELDEKTIFDETFDYFEILKTIRNEDTLETWLLETSLRLSANLIEEREDTTQNLIRSAKKYIYENYSNSELSLEMICGFLHISATYFSTIFKREVGESYTTYLTGIRMEKASELLSTTQEKTYVIAKAVGYEESNYFGYVFKKKYGVSPNKYRGK